MHKKRKFEHDMPPKYKLLSKVSSLKNITWHQMEIIQYSIPLHSKVIYHGKSEGNN